MVYNVELIQASFDDSVENTYVVYVEQDGDLIDELIVESDSESNAVDAIKKYNNQ